MKHLLLIAILGTSVLVLSSCRQSRVGYGPYGLYPSKYYNTAPGGWDVYKSRNSVRVKYTE